ncbi:MAG: FtsW/RodA/SpoVE family cell cycle protein [Candidatus Caenarcaniphilales bacterium]|jgi:cell division protein FtsW|nr:FtsW/RodA/SpoVE family cell cycle protein [Candidatus Caenarcaniphilales bacterium]
MQDRPSPVDNFFTQLTYALIIFGICFVVSASWNESQRYYGSPWILILKHAISITIGCGLMYLVSFIHVGWAKKYAWYLMGITIVGLLITAKWGIVSGGSRRWLDLGFMNVQISEFAKVMCPLVIAKAWVEKKGFWKAVAALLVCAGLVLKQPDLGTSMIVFTSGFIAYFAAGANLIFLALIATAIVFAGWEHIQSTPYQMERIRYWLEPQLDPLGHGYNLIQSTKAIASGGLWGQGFGGSIQKLGPLPIPYADFIFSVISEEIGFLGCIVLLTVFLAWILRALYISASCKDPFAKIFGFAVVVAFGLQVVINIGVATGMFPITGITLPFISFGGSSFISSCLMAGIIMNISRLNNYAQSANP